MMNQSKKKTKIAEQAPRRKARGRRGMNSTVSVAAPAVSYSLYSRNTLQFGCYGGGNDTVLRVSGSNRVYSVAVAAGAIRSFTFPVNLFGFEAASSPTLPPVVSYLGNAFAFYRINRLVAHAYTVNGTSAPGEYVLTYVRDPATVNSTTVPTTSDDAHLLMLAQVPGSISGPCSLPLVSDFSGMIKDERDWKYVSRPYSTYGAPDAGKAALARTQDYGDIILTVSAGTSGVTTVLFFEWEVELKGLSGSITVDYVGRPAPVVHPLEEKVDDSDFEEVQGTNTYLGGAPQESSSSTSSRMVRAPSPSPSVTRMMAPLWGHQR